MSSGWGSKSRRCHYKNENRASFPHSLSFLWYSRSQKLWLDCWQSTSENCGFYCLYTENQRGCIRRGEKWCFLSWIKTMYPDVADKELKLLNQWYTLREMYVKRYLLFFLSFLPLSPSSFQPIQRKEPGTEEEGSNWHSKSLFLDTFTLSFASN